MKRILYITLALLLCVQVNAQLILTANNNLTITGIKNQYGDDYTMTAGQSINALDSLTLDDIRVSNIEALINSGDMTATERQYEYTSDEFGNLLTDYSYIPIVFTQPAIVVNNQGGGNTTTGALNKTITLPKDGSYILTLSFNYNSDAATSDVTAFATWDGAAIDLNDRAGDPEGNNQIMRIEVKDTANSPAGAITGTGSGQKLPYTGKFLLTSQTKGDHILVIDVGSEAASIEGSIWNIVGVLQRVKTQ